MAKHGLYKVNTQGMGAVIYAWLWKLFELLILAIWCEDGTEVVPLVMCFVCIMFWGLPRRSQYLVAGSFFCNL